MRYYSDYPRLQVGGPTYQWVAESLAAAERVQRVAPEIVTPLLLLQAAEDRVVDNASQLRFCQTLAAAGNAPGAARRWSSRAHVMRSCLNGTASVPKR